MSLNKTLMELYKKETGNVATYKKNSCTYHFLAYVDWLEDRLSKEILEPVKRIKKCPKCGSSNICYWTCHNRFGCYDCDWVERTEYC